MSVPTAISEMSTQIIPLKDRTEGALVDLECRAFATNWLSSYAMQRILRSSSALVLAAERDKRLAGCAIVFFRRGSQIARLYSLAVAPEMRRRGVASKLLRAVEGHARRRRCGVVRLEVRSTNRAAISCYRKHGYKEFGRYFAYYHDDSDALRFEKEL